jgi:hypothetical protein
MGGSICQWACGSNLSEKPAIQSAIGGSVTARFARIDLISVTTTQSLSADPD